MTLAVVKGGAAAAVLLCVASCTGSLFQSKAAPAAMYRLSAPPQSSAIDAFASAAEVAADVAVLRPRVRAGLQSDRIVILYPDRHLDYFAGARWSGPLEQVMQDLTVQILRQNAHLRNVTADSSAFASAYWLELEIADFQAEYSTASAPIIHVRLFARLGRARDRQVLSVFEAQAHEPAAENRLSSIVAAYEKAADSALRDLALQTSAAITSSLQQP